MIDILLVKGKKRGTYLVFWFHKAKTNPFIQHHGQQHVPLQIIAKYFFNELKYNNNIVWIRFP